MPGEAWTALALIIVAVITYLLAPLVKARVEQPTDDEPSPGDRALDQIFADLREARRDLDDEQGRHQVTRDEYLRVAQRLAKVEAEARFLREQLREREQAIEMLRAEMRSLRSEIAELRSSSGSE